MVERILGENMPFRFDYWFLAEWEALKVLHPAISVVAAEPTGFSREIQVTGSISTSLDHEVMATRSDLGYVRAVSPVFES